jgi:hypothetical protein
MATCRSRGRKPTGIRRAFHRQHRSLFARFHRYLRRHGVTVAAFGTDRIDGFFVGLERDCAQGKSTRLRYLKLLDRLARHLSLLGLRAVNSAASLLPRERWRFVAQRTSSRSRKCATARSLRCYLALASALPTHHRPCGAVAVDFRQAAAPLVTRGNLSRMRIALRFPFS